MTYKLLLTLIITFIAACSIQPSSGPLPHNVSAPAPIAEEAQAQKVTEETTVHATEKPQIEPTKPIDTRIWPRLISGFSLLGDISVRGNVRVNKEQQWYLRQPGYIETLSQRSQKYIHYILNEVAERDMPTEVALLPAVESGFDPFAYSYVSASGLWQFMPRTGASFGLKRDWWKDDRRDVVMSTQAALTYLEQLNQRFNGDWLLALAAYNSGAGNVSKAIRKNKKLGKPTDFWHLDLPKQTQHYVPRLLAIAKTIQDAKAHDVKLADIQDVPFFSEVNTQSQVDLAQAASLAGIEMDELAMLNPSYNRFATHPEGPHRMLVPAQKAEMFEQRLKKLPPQERVSWQRYTIKNGDSLSVIAAKFNMNTETVKSINQLDTNTIRAGKTLLIPIASDSQRFQLANGNPQILAQQGYSPPKKSIKKIYIVKPGDSLWSIASLHDTSVKKLIRWNRLSKRDILRPGQKMTLWFTATNKQTLAGSQALQKMFYKVRRGDSLHLIADKFNIGVNDIKKWNNVVGKKYLQPGDKLTLFVDVTNIN